MHRTAFNRVAVALSKYQANYSNPRVLDFGSQAVQDQQLTFRDALTGIEHTYTGVDLVEGANVDVVVDEPYTLPFDDDSFDIIITGSTLAHIPFVWVTFLELARVLSPGGIIIATTPARGHIIPSPYDCYRFNPDGYRALSVFAGLHLLEAEGDLPPTEPGKNTYDLKRFDATHYWGDTVGVFQKVEANKTALSPTIRTQLRKWANAHADIFVANEELAPQTPLEVDAPLIKHGEFDVWIPVHPEILNPKMQASVTSGVYETKEAKFALAHLKPGARILELGGGLGFISTVAQQKNPAEYTVIEADPRLVRIIEETHAANNVTGVEVRNCAVTSDPDQLAAGSIKMQIGNVFAGSSVKEKKGSGRYLQVDTVALSDYLENMKPTALLIDIEGAEEDLFKGVDLAPVELIVIEVHPPLIGEDGVDKIVAQLADQGLAIVDANPQRTVYVFERRSRGPLSASQRAAAQDRLDEVAPDKAAQEAAAKAAADAKKAAAKKAAAKKAAAKKAAAKKEPDTFVDRVARRSYREVRAVKRNMGKARKVIKREAGKAVGRDKSKAGK